MLAAMTASADGYFPRGSSTLRRVHGARVVGLLYGQRALLLQATQPLAFTGLMQQTSGLDAPFRRLAHTATTMEAVFFGSRADADRETARVRAAHARVRGRIGGDAGPWPAGSRYAADDPELLLWILVCLADSAQAVYERFVRRLSSREREQFWREYALVGELFGLPRSHAPRTYADYRQLLREELASDRLHVTPEARELGRRVAFDLPLPARRRAALPVVNFAVAGLLPERVRELYGLRWGPDRDAALEALALWLRASARVTPTRLRRGSCAADYELVARTERERLRRAA